MQLMTHAEALAEIATHSLASTTLECRLLTIGFIVTARHWCDVSPQGLGSLFFSRFADEDGAFEAPRFALLVRDLLQDYDGHPEYAPTAADQALLEYLRAMLTYLRTVPPGEYISGDPVATAPHGERLRCELAV